ncbi:MAG: quinone-dependent dihydroorotate dehydrogenase [Pyrinomonadaceae bacterium]
MIYKKLIRPILFRLEPERAHELALHSLSLISRSHLARKSLTRSHTSSHFGLLERFGLEFSNPVGLAAGFDKNGQVAPAIAALGFGHLEVGTVTNIPQPGNPRPRLFRLPLDKALINRAGFNNDGAAALVRRIDNNRASCVLGINIGKSSVVPLENAIEDYCACFETVFDSADYLAINVSSPNTPQLRELQQARALDELLAALQALNNEIAFKRNRSPLPLLVKISPDLNDKEIESIVEVSINRGLAGIIATNTTVSRERLVTPAEEVERFGQGGLSGAPLRAHANEIVKKLYRLSRRRLHIIGVGGIFNSQDAWERICAGASLVQLYTAFVYNGMNTAKQINDGLAEIISRNGLKHLDEAVGCKAD